MDLMRSWISIEGGKEESCESVILVIFCGSVKSKNIYV